jgi:threonine dehydratase
MVCGGCGHEVPLDEPRPFRCPNADDGGDVDHVLAPVPGGAADPKDPGGFRFDGDENPFRRYGELLQGRAFMLSKGRTTGDWDDLVVQMDDAVARVDGGGFRRTPYAGAPALADAVGWDGVLWVKDETGNVAGSHKARHLMGVALHQEAAIGSGHPELAGLPLAVASCGNAAVAAAVIARAWADLETEGGCGGLIAFVPEGADRRVLARLGALGAGVVVCTREDDGIKGSAETGDPCLPAFRQAVARGSVPFTCQGTENGLVLDGGRTLAFEIAEQHGAASPRPLDRIFLQVGGGALTSSVIAGLEVARSLGASACGGAGPAIHPVQTENCHPLYRAWTRLVSGVEQRAIEDGFGVLAPHSADRELAAWLLEHSELLEAELEYAACHRSEFMWPWEVTSGSPATGILDDETWDWLAILKGTARSGGWPIVVAAQTVRDAALIGQEHTGIGVDATGAAGLAGLMEWTRSDEAEATRASELAQEHATVIFTGGTGLPLEESDPDGSAATGGAS